eukprot:Blabericola_migrator_1__2540@NODE_1716_length_3934_cov_45_123093_g1111_i0_p1_GENE_NODE_1716_length_3934_cov_45_123093_g1111_i0NODE_1716_length_3934_cov_45_123093_g1111_i0_p1_ORF_typecomplete_len785_score85_35CsgA/PF17334_2/0_57_NODE_1716_length_3934_cov_45_123093_g1111_i0972451
MSARTLPRVKAKDAHRTRKALGQALIVSVAVLNNGTGLKCEGNCEEAQHQRSQRNSPNVSTTDSVAQSFSEEALRSLISRVQTHLSRFRTSNDPLLNEVLKTVYEALSRCSPRSLRATLQPSPVLSPELYNRYRAACCHRFGYLPISVETLVAPLVLRELMDTFKDNKDALKAAIYAHCYVASDIFGFSAETFNQLESVVLHFLIKKALQWIESQKAVKRCSELNEIFKTALQQLQSFELPKGEVDAIVIRDALIRAKYDAELKVLCRTLAVPRMPPQLEVTLAPFIFNKLWSEDDTNKKKLRVAIFDFCSTAGTVLSPFQHNFRTAMKYLATQPLDLTIPAVIERVLHRVKQSLQDSWNIDVKTVPPVRIPEGHNKEYFAEFNSLRHKIFGRGTYVPLALESLLAPFTFAQMLSDFALSETEASQIILILYQHCVTSNHLYQLPDELLQALLHNSCNLLLRVASRKISDNVSDLAGVEQLSPVIAAAHRVLLTGLTERSIKMPKLKFSEFLRYDYLDRRGVLYEGLFGSDVVVPSEVETLLAPFVLKDMLKDATAFANRLSIKAALVDLVKRANAVLEIQSIPAIVDDKDFMKQISGALLSRKEAVRSLKYPALVSLHNAATALLCRWLRGEISCDALVPLELPEILEPLYQRAKQDFVQTAFDTLEPLEIPHNLERLFIPLVLITMWARGVEERPLIQRVLHDFCFNAQGILNLSDDALKEIESGDQFDTLCREAHGNLADLTRLITTKEPLPHDHYTDALASLHSLLNTVEIFRDRVGDLN